MIEKIRDLQKQGRKSDATIIRRLQKNGRMHTYELDGYIAYDIDEYALHKATLKCGRPPMKMRIANITLDNALNGCLTVTNDEEREYLEKVRDKIDFILTRR